MLDSMHDNPHTAVAPGLGRMVDSMNQDQNKSPPAELQVDAAWQRRGNDVRGSISVRTTRPLAFMLAVAIIGLAVLAAVWSARSG